MASLILQGGHYEWSLVNDSITYDRSHIVSGTLSDGIFTKCGFGNVISRQLNLRLWNVTIDPTKPIYLYVDLVSSAGVHTTRNKGTYYIDTVSTSPYSEYTEVTAFDALLKTEAVYMKSGTWTSTTDYAIVVEICDSIGVTWNSTNKSYFNYAPKTIDQAPNIGTNGTTMRQMLSMIGCLRGGNWIINDAGELVFVPLFGIITSNNTISWQSSATYVVGDEVVEFDKSDAEELVGIEFQANGGEIFRAPSSLTDVQWDALDGLIIINNLPCMASQTAVNDVWTTYSSLTTSVRTYTPFTANGVYLDPTASLGYLASIKQTYVYVANRTINIDELATCDMSIEPTKQVTSHYPVLDPQVREARQKAEENYAAITVLPNQIMSEVYTKGETDERISTIVTQTASDITTTFTREVGEAVGEANQYTDGKTEVVTSYIREFDDGVETGIEIGRSDNAFKARLSNKELAFTGEDGEKAAWISSNQLYVNQMVTPGSSGKWVQQTSFDDHLQIRWVSN